MEVEDDRGGAAEDGAAEGPAGPRESTAAGPFGEDRPELLRLAGRRATGRGFGFLGVTLGLGIVGGLPLAWGMLADDLPTASAGSFLVVGLVAPALGLAVGSFVEAGAIGARLHRSGGLRGTEVEGSRRASRPRSWLIYGGVVAAGLSLAMVPPILVAVVDHPPPPPLAAGFAGGIATSLSLSTAFLLGGLLPVGQGQPGEGLAAVVPWFGAAGGGACAVVVF